MRQHAPHSMLSITIETGGVLSPYLFSVYMDSIISKIQESRIGCHLGFLCYSIILFADDMLLISPSVTGLQKLLYICEKELEFLDLSVNAKKSFCLRIGPRHRSLCANICTSAGDIVSWASEIRYLGIFIKSAMHFKCSFDNAKQSFFRSFNAVYGKIGVFAKDELLIQLVKSKCLPSLLYATEALPLSKADINSLEFTFNRILFKIFKTSSIDIVHDICFYFNLSSVVNLIIRRKFRFLSKMLNSGNMLCASCKDMVTLDLKLNL